ncbi:hypothetical protein BBP40_005182 [Aspergillus hancockii]|nr:hypothetical protein BBP40_005182 [Aspergillus hancockii]
MIHYYSQSARSPNGRKPWLSLLPNLVNSSGPHSQVAVLATSLLFLASQSNEQRIFVEALRSLVLSFFESLSSTLVNGYYEHVQGAVALLQMQGPHNCASMPYRSLFTAVRNHAICASLMTGKESPFAEETWLTIPFSDSRKSDSDLINDIMLVIPKYLSAFSSQNLPVKQDMIADVLNLLAQLNPIWDRISDQEYPRADAVLPEMTSTTELAPSRSWEYLYDNPYHAKTIASYRAAHFLVLSILLTVLPSFDLNIESLIEDSASIISQLVTSSSVASDVHTSNRYSRCDWLLSIARVEDNGISQKTCWNVGTGRNPIGALHLTPSIGDNGFFLVLGKLNHRLSSH